jgi:hypothetical protein
MKSTQEIQDPAGYEIPMVERLHGGRRQNQRKSHPAFVAIPWIAAAFQASQ